MYLLSNGLKKNMACSYNRINRKEYKIQKDNYYQIVLKHRIHIYIYIFNVSLYWNQFQFFLEYI